jgi:hypothetical protein
MAEGIPKLVGINVALALKRRDAALAHMDSENASLRGSGFNLDAAGPPYWDRNVWEQYKNQFGRYPYDHENRPPDLVNAPTWVKKICGMGLTPAERMGGGPA